jgi:hypothetical protein
MGYVYKQTGYVPIGKPDPEEVEAFRVEGETGHNLCLC